MQVGQQVIASYYEQTFAAVIESKRALTVKTDGASEFFLRDESGELRCVYARFDGSPSSYCKFSTRLVAA